MSKQRPDPHETRDAYLPLFAPRLSTLFSPSDPETSRRAAVKAIRDLGKRQREALDLVRKRPGSTARELGHVQAADLTFNDPLGTGEAVDPEWCRQRIGRRLNELEKAGLIHRSGERDGCCLWWPGPEVKP